MATLSALLSFGLAKAYANNPWLITEPEAVGVRGWQTGAKALCLYSQSPQYWCVGVSVHSCVQVLDGW